MDGFVKLAQPLKTMDGSEAMRLGPEELARRARLMAVPSQSPWMIVGGSAAMPRRLEGVEGVSYERRTARREEAALAV
ncbi:hypothetical protein IAI18_16220 [Acetobacteraceae bacterium H6797]|nr:hypothetical protein [Acetobacteraceae bacterium H6797]